MKLLMVGAGAVGGYFGGRLAEAGHDVTFLVRAGRRDTLRRTGLAIQSPLGDASLTPALLTADELRASSAQHYDVVMLSTKAYSLAEAIEDVAPAIGEGTLVMPLLNGMQQLDVLRERFGAAHVLGGSVRIIGDLDAEGRILQLTKLGEISYGALPGSGVTPGRMAQLDAVMKVPGVTALLQPDIVAAMWQKWSIVASMGAICLLAGGTLGETASAPRGLAVADGVLDECLAIASANGYPPNDAVFTEHRARLHDTASTLTSSLYRDMTRGLPVEADHLLGDLVARAGTVPVPLLNAAYVRLKVYEQRQSR